MTSAIAAQLHEEVLIQEGFLEQLLQRKEAIRLRASTAKETKTTKEARLMELKLKQQQLMASRQRHAELRHELEQALEKSRERLLKIGGMEAMLTSEDDEEEPTNDSTECDNKNAPLNETHHSHNETAMAHATLLSSSLPSSTSLHKLQEFRSCPKDTVPYISAFMPHTSSNRLETMMNVTALETLVLDKHRYTDGIHRRQTLYQSILWLRGDDYALDDRRDDGRMDPDMTLCPYELTGECADPYCPFQHLTPRPKVSRERLRLPDTKLPASGTIIHEPSKKRRKIETKRLQKQHTESCIAVSTEELWMEHDYISLPPSREDRQDYVDADDTDDEGYSGEPMPEFWWQKEDDKSRIGNQDPSKLSFLQWLHVFFQIKVSVNHVETPEPSSDDLILFVGKITDAIRISVHAGRFDVATGIGYMANEFCSLTEGAKDLLGPLALVMDLVSSAWKYHEEPNGPFLAAFRSNIGMAMLSEYFRLLQSRGEKINANTYSLIEQLFDATGMTKNCFQRDRNVGKTLEGLFPADQGVNHILQCYNAYRKGYATIRALLECTPDEAKNILQQCVRSAQSGRVCSASTPSTFSATVISLGFSALGASLRLEKSMDHDDASVMLKHIDFTARILHTQNHDVMMQTIMSPIHALQVCGLVRERNYRQAQLCLELHLTNEMSKFSELMWCQYVHLRSTLPWSQDFACTKHQGRIDLPDEILAEHRAITTLIDELDIHCNHLSLSGDAVLLMQVCSRERGSAGLEKWTEATLSGNATSQSVDLSNQSLGVARESQVAFGASIGMQPELNLPRSLFVGGWAISSLDLMNCQIAELPLPFGQYFENLQSLVLSKNNLKSLPSSIGLLAKLETLDASHNSLKSLPAALVDCISLKVLDVSNNNIMKVHWRLEECRNLESLDLRYNPGLRSPSNLIPKLRSLKDFKIGGDSVNEFVMARLAPKSGNTMDTAIHTNEVVLHLPSSDQTKTGNDREEVPIRADTDVFKKIPETS